MTRLRLAPDLALPPDAVTSTQVVYGGKGMGKTNYGSVLVEEMTKAGLRWSVLDPLGVWWGLRHSADGKGPGIECLIIGGTHGDLPLDPSNGAVVADLVAEEEGVNVVIDFSRKSTGEMWTVGERVRFVTAYALRLFQRQGELIRGQRRPPLMQVLDESARYIPQLLPKSDAQIAACVGAWEQFTEEGRNVGLGVTFLTQRSARMNKSVSELADVMVAFRIVGPRSVEAVTDWLGAHVERRRANEIVEQIRSLPVGHALVVSPGWLGVEKVVSIRLRETFDSSATPKPGERRREPAKGAKPDLEKYRERMQETIEQVKANDPKELKRRIAELEKQQVAKHSHLRLVKPGEGKDPQATKTIATLRAALEEAMKFVLTVNAQDFASKAGEGVDREALERAIAGAAQEAVRLIDKGLQSRNQQLDQIRREGQRLAARLRKIVDVEDVEVEVNVRQNEPFTVSPARTRGAQAARLNGGGSGESSVPPSERKILTALAQYPDGRTVRQVAILTGYTLGGGRFNNLLGALRSSGYLNRSGDGLRITDAGVTALGAWEPLPSGPDLLDYWLRQLPPSEGKILRTVSEQAPISYAALAAATDYTAGGGRYNNILGKLRTLELINRGDPIALSEELT